MPDEKHNRAEELARAALQDIVSKIKRLDHAAECSDGVACEATDAEIFAGINIYDDGTSKPTTEERAEYHDEEAAKENITDDCYGTQVRSDWVTPGEAFEAVEYTLLPAGGGPALRMIGDLGEFNQPDSAHLEYQDWFTPWEEFIVEEDEDREALLKYASQFYFGD